MTGREEVGDRRIRNEVRKAAFKRLIEAHPEEWDRLRAEEWERLRPGKPPTSDPTRADLPVDEMAQLYKDGESLRDLATRYGVGKETVRTYLLPTGVLREPLNKVVDLPEKEIRRLYEAGASLDALGVKYGVTRMTIRSRLPDEIIRGRGAQRKKR